MTFSNLTRKWRSQCLHQAIDVNVSRALAQPSRAALRALLAAAAANTAQQQQHTGDSDDDRTPHP